MEKWIGETVSPKHSRDFGEMGEIVNKKGTKVLIVSAQRVHKSLVLTQTHQRDPSRVGCRAMPVGQGRRDRVDHRRMAPRFTGGGREEQTHHDPSALLGASCHQCVWQLLDIYLRDSGKICARPHARASQAWAPKKS